MATLLAISGTIAVVVVMTVMRHRAYWRGFADGASYGWDMGQEIPDRLSEREDYEVWN